MSDIKNNNNLYIFKVNRLQLFALNKCKKIEMKFQHSLYTVSGIIDDIDFKNSTVTIGNLYVLPYNAIHPKSLTIEYDKSVLSQLIHNNETINFNIIALSMDEVYGHCQESNVEIDKFYKLKLNLSDNSQELLVKPIYKITKDLKDYFVFKILKNKEKDFRILKSHISMRSRECIHELQNYSCHIAS